ncbi:hypothetical protein BKA00_001041 [Actinomadura coerulea]|uniref:SRPBCC family protein n=1 Tax=Actinomadura coerulea TaxID=46159 RepID=A0A7X0KXA7_9ACTN|nr:hypothetical protein [Actinomadura coerulea]MBB6394127.1 hypothetical protein [Actinomadura coerulea]GGQ20420.1 hypothetical protein GCM10010187_40950 [Actinomadura coerulea]
MSMSVRGAALACGAAAAYAAAIRPALLSWGATDTEAAASYPSDGLIEDATSQSTMAVSLPAPPEAVWPWLVQMGWGRGGWYSWDLLDNGGRPSTDRIVPEWQDLAVGDRVPTVPGGTTYFRVEVLDPGRTLVLRSDVMLPSGRSFDPRGPRPRAYADGIWAFHLHRLPDGCTRLIVRTRGRGVPSVPDRLFTWVLGEPAHFIMQHRQFRELRRRVARRGLAGVEGAEPARGRRGDLRLLR